MTFRSQYQLRTLPLGHAHRVIQAILMSFVINKTTLSPYCWLHILYQIIIKTTTTRIVMDRVKLYEILIN